MEEETAMWSVQYDKFGYRLKKCAICKRMEGKLWQRHWKKQHPGRTPKELKEGESAEFLVFNKIDKRYKKGYVPGSG